MYVYLTLFQFTFVLGLGVVEEMEALIDQFEKVSIGAVYVIVDVDMGNASMIGQKLYDDFVLCLGHGGSELEFTRI